MQRTLVDTTTATFAARLAAILRAARDDQERSVRSVAWASRGRFRLRTLRELESGQADLRGVDLAALAALYRIDLAELLQDRVPIRADLDAGTIATAGLVRSFTPGDSDALLTAYLHLVRDLRDLRTAPSIALRRDDVETLAASLRAEATVVLDRLGQLMGSTVTQRRSAMAMFLAGAALIVLSTGAVALEPGSYRPAADAEAGAEVAITLAAAADDLGDGGDPAGGPDPFPTPGDPGLDVPAAEGGGPAAATAVVPGAGGPDAGQGGGPAAPAPVATAPTAPDGPSAGAAVPAPDASSDASGSEGSDGVDAPGGVEVPDAPGEAGPPAPVELPAPVAPPDVTDPPDAPGASDAVTGPSQPPVLDRPVVDAPPVDLPPVDVPPVDGPLIEAPPVVEAPPVQPPVGGDRPPEDVPVGGDLPPVDAPPEEPPGQGGHGGGGTPGNSPEVGNTVNVGQPGNSGNTNAGGRGR